ncbi:MAG: tRNA pseudouridine(55) synthase TruB [Magnetococcales bacterium]|nr:tRNA pseudouridine(55) synthase TruB [Magnetococcales bacterium]MBF0438964.1 tRNA pseudouridine(55) synthase TruB [Magnetococcales bacterium]
MSQVRRRTKSVKLNGWLAVHKEAGMTSTRVVEKVKQITRADKAGHGGTLDPFSEGVLPVALGEATKTLGLVLNGDKAYRCWIRLGAESDTGDPTGIITPGGGGPLPDRETVVAALAAYHGEQEQVPPIYSAIHVNGERAYEIARRGETVVMEPRRVVFHHLELVTFADGLAVVDVRCSKGTYMRSLARDLGRDLGCLAYLERLLRTRSLGFALAECKTLDVLAETVEAGRLAEVLLPVDRALDDIPALRLRLEAWSQIMNGQAVWMDADGVKPGTVRLLSPEGVFGAMGSLGQGLDASGRSLCTPKRLFHAA